MKPHIATALRITCGQGSTNSVAVFHRLPTTRFYPGSAYKTVFRNKTRFAYPEGMKAYEDDYTEIPEYPPIVPEERDRTPSKTRQIQKQTDFQATIKNSPTLDEKLIQWNVPRKYGWFSTDLTEDMFNYDCLPYYQYATRTHFMPRGELPDRYAQPDIAEKCKHYTETLKKPFEDLLRLELRDVRRKVDENDQIRANDYMLARTNNIVYQVNRFLLAFLIQDAPHLRDCQVDYRPKLEAFWQCAGFEPSSKLRRSRKKSVEYMKKIEAKFDYTEDDPVEMNLQYRGSSLLQLRCKEPISNFVEQGSSFCELGEQIPERFRTNYRNYGLKSQLRLATILPGHWMGDDNKSSLLSIHPQHHLHMSHKQTQYWDDDKHSALDSQAALSSFSRMLAQAYSYGFDQFTDLDYPFSTQSISTDGENWAFYSYQLNTIGLGELQYRKNKLQNICWRTENMSILDEGGNLNVEVLDNLVKFYLNPPTPIKSPKGNNITPYISEKLSEISDDYRRVFIYRNLREMYYHKFTRQGAAHTFPEIYDWEKIYKIYFKKRPMDARRRFFEFPRGFEGRIPYDEQYELRKPFKMPRALFRYKKELREAKEQKELDDAVQTERQKFIKDEKAKDNDDEL